MQGWLVGAMATALLFGGYNIFAKQAAGKLSDSLAAFLLEACAAFAILIFWVTARPVKAELSSVTIPGVLYSLAAGLFVGAGSIIYFYVFRSKGPLTIAGPIIFAGVTLVVVLGGVLIFREKLDLLTALGLLLTLAGIAVLSYAGNRG